LYVVTTRHTTKMTITPDIKIVLNSIKTWPRRQHFSCLAYLVYKLSESHSIIGPNLKKQSLQSNKELFHSHRTTEIIYSHNYLQVAFNHLMNVYSHCNFHRIKWDIVNLQKLHFKLQQNYNVIVTYVCIHVQERQ
jgi:hypothetical protein